MTSERPEIPLAVWSPDRPWLTRSVAQLVSVERKGSDEGTGVWLMSEQAVCNYLNDLEAQLAAATAALAEAERDAEMLARLLKVQPCAGEGCKVCDALAKHDRRTTLRQQTETPAS